MRLPPHPCSTSLLQAGGTTDSLVSRQCDSTQTSASSTRRSTSVPWPLRSPSEYLSLTPLLTPPGPALGLGSGSELGLLSPRSVLDSSSGPSLLLRSEIVD